MTRFDETAEKDELRFRRGRCSRDAVGRGRWINPILGVLGTLVLGGYLMTGHPSTPAATALAPLSDERLAPAYSQETGSLGSSGVVRNESTSSSLTDLLKTAFGAALALAWAVGGAWLGMRRARAESLLDEPAAHMHTTSYSTQTVYGAPRAPTCQRMYDEARLVPHYLRRIEFPATKRDLLCLAREHPDEGRTLHRLEYIPDRRYSSLHDLITEIRID
jgi:hypothetical protein